MYVATTELIYQQPPQGGLILPKNRYENLEPVYCRELLGHIPESALKLSIGHRELSDKAREDSKCIRDLEESEGAIDRKSLDWARLTESINELVGVEYIIKKAVGEVACRIICDKPNGFVLDEDSMYSVESSPELANHRTLGRIITAGETRIFNSNACFASDSKYAHASGAHYSELLNGIAERADQSQG